MEGNDPGIELRKLVDSPLNPCFVCGPGNPHGLHVHLEQREGGAYAEFWPEEWHQGWEGVVHGGVLAALLDEAMAYTLFFAGLKGLTARMEVRYRNPARAGRLLSVQARVLKDSTRLTDITASIMQHESVIAEATGRFVKLGMIDAVAIAGPANPGGK